MQPTPTRSPTLYLVTPSPTAETTPAISWPGTMGKMRAAPLLADLVDVAVADAGELDVDEDVVVAQVTVLDGAGLEGGAGGRGGQGGRGDHGVSFVFSEAVTV